MRALAASLVVAAVFASTAARADEIRLIGRGTAEAGFIHEQRLTVPNVVDFHADAIPEVAFMWLRPTSLLTMSYSLTAAAHTTYASELGQRAAMDFTDQLSQRTTLLTGASASRMTLGNLFLTQPTATSVTSLSPSTSTTILTADVHETLTHELSDKIQVDQEATAQAFETLPPAPSTKSYYTSLGGGLERVWSTDAIGFGVLGALARMRAQPPLPNQSLLVLNAGPRWRSDWSQTWSTLLSAGVVAVKSLDHPSSTYWAPTARAQFLYQNELSQLTGSVGTGIQPNPLTGQIVQSHTVDFHATTPVSLRSQVFFEASAGFTRGKLIDRVNPSQDLDYNNFIADGGLIWEVASHAELFVRYTWTGQTGNASSPLLSLGQTFIRNSALVGVTFSTEQLTSRGGRKGIGAPGLNGLPTGLPQRVDHADQLGPPKEDHPEPNAPAPLYDRDRDNND